MRPAPPRRPRGLLRAVVASLAVAMTAARAAPPDSPQSPQSPQSPWTLKRDKAGIRVHTRPGPGGYLEFKGDVLLEGVPLHAALALLDDTASYPRWMYECRAARVLARVDFAERYTHTIIRSPWPFQDRDLVGHARMKQDPETFAVTVRIESAPAFYPAQKGIVRIARMEGRWTFEPRKGGLAVTYQMYMEPGGSLSAGMSNLVVDSIPWETLRRFREVVREAPYARASYPEIALPPADPDQ